MRLQNGAKAVEPFLREKPVEQDGHEQLELTLACLGSESVIRSKQHHPFKKICMIRVLSQEGPVSIQFKEVYFLKKILH